MISISVVTSRSSEFVDIGTEVDAALKELGVANGTCLVFCPHTTAGITLNECCDPAVAVDMVTAFDALISDRTDWSHLEGNSSAHVKASLVGNSLAIPVENGQLKLGRWQGVFLCEFDGPRTRAVWVQMVS